MEDDIRIYDEDGSAMSEAIEEASKMTRLELEEAYAKAAVESFGMSAYVDACWAGARYSLRYETDELPTEVEIDERIQEWWDMCLPPKSPN